MLFTKYYGNQIYKTIMAILVEKYIISGKRYPASGNLLGIPFTRMRITKF